jgi:MSHA pilin protein MshD
MVEAVLSILLVGLTLVAALSTVGGAARARRIDVDRRRSASLAQDLISEILQARYEEPDGEPLFGRETGEAGAARTEWDDVDDYHGLSESPPRDRDGAALPGTDGWTRKVEVAWVTPANPAVAVYTDTDLKRVRVEVTSPGGAAYVLHALRSRHSPGEQLPAAETTYVGRAGIELQIGADGDPLVSGAVLWNQIPVPSGPQPGR